MADLCQMVTFVKWQSKAALEQLFNLQGKEDFRKKEFYTGEKYFFLFFCYCVFSVIISYDT
jgi:hypothetical protein